MSQIMSIAEREARLNYLKRDKAAERERALEETIFNPNTIWTEDEIKSMTKQYQQVKDIRAHWSILAAKYYMMLSLEEREALTNEWKNSNEGKRKSRDSGIRGKHTEVLNDKE